MAIKQLNAKGKGEYKYDYKNDIMLFKTKDRNYKISLEFGNIVADVDDEGLITGLRIFDASSVFSLPKMALKNVKVFEFSTKVEDKIVSMQLKFKCILRNKQAIMQGQDFIRESYNSNLKDSRVVCSIA